jgi:Uma2 family endonuclease
MDEVFEMLTTRAGPRNRTIPARRAPAPDGYMSEHEFAAWALSNEDARAEWEDGKVILMAPVSDAEDDINGWLSAILRLFVEQRELGVIKGPNFFVRFARQKRRRIPDLLFVASSRKHLIRETYLEGAPDAAVEIVSRDSQTLDRRKKYQEYEKGGVREYWIIDPLSQTLEAYALRRGRYAEIDARKGAVRSIVLPGFYVKPEWLFRRPLPKVLAIQKELGLI